MKERIAQQDHRADFPHETPGETVKSNAVSIASFVVFALGDIAFSLYHRLPVDALLVAVILLISAFAISISNQQKHFLHPLIVFILSVVAVLAMVLINGFATGSCLYFFPAAVVYLVNTIDKNDEKTFGNFRSITLLFILAVAVGYFILPHQNIIPAESLLPAYRFFAAIILSVLLSKKLFLQKRSVQHVPGLSAYSKSIFQNSLDGYIVFNQETREVTDHNQRILSLFTLPPGADLKNLFMTQVLMRYLADDSANKELMMDMIPDNWHGEATFITQGKEKFYSYIKSIVFQTEETKYQVLSIRDISSIKASDEKLKEYKESVEKAGKAKARFFKQHES